ncbi:hypothetical protein T484DRAFT_1918698 [Baffinella frigidus]|nr:hypothetical protein T484DRAFT_1918698 [Cryptophyta sp. CCMP2293]
MGAQFLMSEEDDSVSTLVGILGAIGCLLAAAGVATVYVSVFVIELPGVVNENAATDLNTRFFLPMAMAAGGVAPVPIQTLFLSTMGGFACFWAIVFSTGKYFLLLDSLPWITCAICIVLVLSRGLERESRLTWLQMQLWDLEQIRMQVLSLYFYFKF